MPVHNADIAQIFEEISKIDSHSLKSHAAGNHS
jgi:hypothetical protein